MRARCERMRRFRGWCYRSTRCADSVNGCTSIVFWLCVFRFGLHKNSLRIEWPDGGCAVISAEIWRSESYYPYWVWIIVGYHARQAITHWRTTFDMLHAANDGPRWWLCARFHVLFVDDVVPNRPTRWLQTSHWNTYHHNIIWELRASYLMCYATDGMVFYVFPCRQLVSESRLLAETNTPSWRTVVMRCCEVENTL